MARQALAPLGKSRDRLLILGLILTGWALIVVGRLFQLQVLAHDKYEKLAEAQQEELEPMEAPRGAVVDRNGNFLAISSPSQLVVVNPSRIPDKALAAALVGRILNLPAEKLQADLEEAAASKHRRGYFVVEPRVSEEKAEALRGMKLDWLEIREGSLRTYPNGQLAAHVVGNVGADGHGASGIERRLDKELAGTPGLIRVKVDVKRRAYDSEVAKAPVIGKNIGLTIDSQIQEAAENALEEAVKKNHADHGSVVAIDPRNGEILALANFPTYDLNERLHAGEKPVGRENLAVVAPYEPGSVMKVVTLSAALETTRLRPETMIQCAGGVITLFGRTIHDDDRHGDLSMEDVLAHSSNVGAIRIGMQVGSQNLYAYERRFGVGGRTGIELPAEAPGMLRRLSHWQATSLPSVAFGHELSVTTVQLARIGSVFANGGFMIYPHVIAWKQAPSGVREFVHLPQPVQVLKPETVMTMRQMMQRVVTSPIGTAHTLHLVGYTLAGKTGTAQIFDFNHHAYTHKYNASFMGFTPVNNPSFLVVVTLSGTTGIGGFGAHSAGPAFEAIANTALRIREVPRDVPEEVDEIEQKELQAKAKQQELLKSPVDPDPLAALSTPPTEEEFREAIDHEAGGDEALTDVPVAAVQSSAVAVKGSKTPDFVGKTVKDSMEQALASGIELEMQGDGLARAQYPAAGAPLEPGERVRVRFSR